MVLASVEGRQQYVWRWRKECVHINFGLAWLFIGLAWAWRVGMEVQAAAVLVQVHVGGAAAQHQVEDPRAEQDQHGGDRELQQAGDVVRYLGADGENDDGGDQECCRVAESPDGPDQPGAAQRHAAWMLLQRCVARCACDSRGWRPQAAKARGSADIDAQ